MENFAKWSTWDVIKWKLFSEKYGGKQYIQNFKDGWVVYHKDDIRTAASANNISAELLAGVAWVEVGGDPYIVDYIAYYIRAFDWCGPDWLDKHLTMTNNPAKTSFGAVSMQIRVVAETMGIDPKTLNFEKQNSLIRLMDNDASNLMFVAKHLYGLMKHDFPAKSTTILEDDQIRIAGARYNRGVGMSLEALRKNTSYGDFLLKNKERVKKLMNK